jgi:alpha-L-rhamnosidase
MNGKVKWICPTEDMGDVVPRFIRRFLAPEEIKSAVLDITGLGVYAARLNGDRIGNFIMAPGWTTYEKRLQVQTYDVTKLIRPGKENCLEVLLGKGWYRIRRWQRTSLRG